jgi:hypothetical protein
VTHSTTRVANNAKQEIEISVLEDKSNSEENYCRGRDSMKKFEAFRRIVIRPCTGMNSKIEFWGRMKTSKKYIQYRCTVRD